MRDERGRWLKGSASPSPGRPVGSRSKLGDAFVESLQRKWEIEGDAIVDRVAISNPEKILEVMAIDTRAIQDWLGHVSITHTTRYTALSQRRFKDFWR